MADLPPFSEDLREVLHDLAEGRVHRSRHELVVDGRDLTGAFEEVLRRCGYRPARLRDMEVPRGVRFPAFFLQGGVATFGHVFREKFTEEEDRVLFGSVLRDAIGDWSVMLTRRSTEVLWVDLSRGAPFDEDRPSGGR
jgi:hypothetical protein